MVNVDWDHERDRPMGGLNAASTPPSPKCVMCRDTGTFFAVGPLPLVCGCEAGAKKAPWSVKPRAALANPTTEER